MPPLGNRIRPDPGDDGQWRQPPRMALNQFCFGVKQWTGRFVGYILYIVAAELVLDNHPCGAHLFALACAS